MKRAEEYWSIILHNQNLKKKFLSFIDALLKGENFESARRAASLKSQDIMHALVSLKHRLSDGFEEQRESEAGSLSLVAFTDGASRGNPGKAACAVIVYDWEGSELLRRAKKLGETTNNVAEYEGVILAIQLARDLGAAELILKLDSELVVKQLNGEYRVKNPTLASLHSKATRLMGAFSKVVVSHISRKENREADSFVNATLDGKDVESNV